MGGRVKGLRVATVAWIRVWPACDPWTAEVGGGVDRPGDRECPERRAV